MEKSLAQRIKEDVNQFVDGVIKDDLRTAGIREPLERCLLRYRFLKILIANSKNLDELETHINDGEKFLRQRIEHIRKVLQKHVRLKNALINLDTEKSRWRYPVQTYSQDDVFVQLSNDLTDLNNDITKSIAELESFKAELPLFILEAKVSKSYEQFKVLRMRQERRQKRYRFFWAVLIAGFGISFAASSSLKLLRINNWWLLVLGALLTFAVAIIKEYWLSPWVRSRRLELQRKLLLSCLASFHEAELSLIIYSPERELIESMWTKGTTDSSG